MIKSDTVSQIKYWLLQMNRWFWFFIYCSVYECFEHPASSINKYKQRGQINSSLPPVLKKKVSSDPAYSTNSENRGMPPVILLFM
jgi:hypothetical protein